MSQSPSQLTCSLSMYSSCALMRSCSGVIQGLGSRRSQACRQAGSGGGRVSRGGSGGPVRWQSSSSKQGVPKLSVAGLRAKQPSVQPPPQKGRAGQGLPHPRLGGWVVCLGTCLRDALRHACVAQPLVQRRVVHLRQV